MGTPATYSNSTVISLSRSTVHTNNHLNLAVSARFGIFKARAKKQKSSLGKHDTAGYGKQSLRLVSSYYQTRRTTWDAPAMPHGMHVCRVPSRKMYYMCEAGAWHALFCLVPSDKEWADLSFSDNSRKII